MKKAKRRTKTNSRTVDWKKLFLYLLDCQIELRLDDQWYHAPSGNGPYPTNEAAIEDMTKIIIEDMEDDEVEEALSNDISRLVKMWRRPLDGR